MRLPLTIKPWRCLQPAPSTNGGCTLYSARRFAFAPDEAATTGVTSQTNETSPERSADSPHLVRYLLDYLYLVIEAIDDFEITGASGLEQSLNAAVWRRQNRRL
jgi:hypothetical protein